jgi:glutamine synthetase
VNAAIYRDGERVSIRPPGPPGVLKAIKDDKIAMVDPRFTDLPGLWQHFSVPPSALDCDSFEWVPIF